MNRIILLAALLLTFAGLTAALAEGTPQIDGDIVYAAPVEAAVEESPDAEIWTEEIAKDVAEAEAKQAAAQAANAAGDIAIDEAHFPDGTFRTYVLENFDDGDGVLSRAEQDAVTSLNITYGSATHYGKMVTLEGIEFFPNLKELFCSTLGLERVDLSHNRKLTRVSLPFNPLTSLDVSGCPELTVLYVNKSGHDEPGLTKLDVSHNPKLTELGARFNDLTSLDVSACPALVELNVDRNAISSLDVSGKSSLQILGCYGNQITNLNVSGCTSLRNLDCHENQIASLDLTDCASLESIWCYDNQIPSLDVSVTDCLRTLSCGSNPLESLKLSRSLKNLFCVNIPLKTLNLYGCPTLIELSQRTPAREYSSYLGRYYLHYATTSYEMNVDEDMTFVSLEPPTPITACEVAPITDRTYTGKALKPAPVVTGGGVALVRGTDYTVAYADNVNAGTATVAITGIGRYDGTMRVSFTILPRAIGKAKIAAIAAQTYTGRAVKPEPVVKYGGKTLARGDDYKISYSGNKAIGKATVKITGKGNFTGTATKTFRINPKAVALTKLTAGAKKLTVRWAKGSGGAGYEIQYGLKKSFKSAKTVAVARTKTVKKVISGLRSGKTYYVRIRACKTVDGKVYRSAWSDPLHVKVK